MQQQVCIFMVALAIGCGLGFFVDRKVYTVWVSSSSLDPNPIKVAPEVIGSLATVPKIPTLTTTGKLMPAPGESNALNLGPPLSSLLTRAVEVERQFVSVCASLASRYPLTFFYFKLLHSV